MCCDRDVRTLAKWRKQQSGSLSDVLLAIESGGSIGECGVESIKVVRRSELYRNKIVSVYETSISRNTYHEQSIVILQPVDFVEEERPIVIRDQRIDVLEDDQARGFSSSPLEDLLDAYAPEEGRQSVGHEKKLFRIVLPYSSPAYAGHSKPSATSACFTLHSPCARTMKAPDVKHPLGLFPHPFPVGHVPHHRLDADRLSVPRRS